MFLKLFGDGYTFTGSDGKEYKLVNLTLKDLGKYVSWVQFKPYKDALNADLPRSKCDELYEACAKGTVVEEVADGEFKDYPISWSSTVVQKSIFTLEGFMKLLELSFSKTYDFDFESVLTAEQLIHLQKGFFKANGLLEEDDEKTEGKDEAIDTEKN